MPKYQITKILGCVLTVAFLTTGCFNSEADYERVVEDNKQLEQDLQAAQKEQEILNQALADINAERAVLLSQLNYIKKLTGGESGEPGPEVMEATAAVPEGSREGDAPPAVQPAVTPSGKVYVVKTGETLGSIAMQRQTDVQTLLSLNPYLNSRIDNMVWPNDEIQLP